MHSLLLIAFSLLIISSVDAQSLRNVDLVDPFIGTGGHGHTFPGATVPFGMVQLSPDTRTKGWDACGGYHFSDSTILGFSHTHLSGTGVGDYGDILFAPYTGPIQFDSAGPGGRGYRSRFRHATESASPGYYSVTLEDFHIRAELTAGRRVGMHRYTFPKTDNANVTVDLTHGIGDDVTTDAVIRIISGREIAGWRRSTGWAKDQVVYFVARFSQPMVQSAIRGSDSQKVALRFDMRSGLPLLVKVGLSSVDIKGAWKNLAAEVDHWDFDKVKETAREEWEKALSRIEITGGSPAQRRTFFTALYHTMIAPNVFSDVDGRYRGMDGKIHTAEGWERYSVFSLWDTFRAAHPLFTILEPDRTNDFVKTFLSIYKESGTLPVWELAANETWCMIGYHAVPVIVDAYAKGIRGYDVNLAFEAVQASAQKDHFGLNFCRVSGYVPSEKESESVSKTLEYAYDDWCISEFARLMRKEDVRREYARRAQNYRNLFDPSTGFMRPKRNGGWAEPFRPLAVTVDYTEANAWQYLFFAPHDVPGMMELHGGREGFVKKLDEMFTTSSTLEGRHQLDITGLIGQYAHGNEPSHHIAYLYAYAGEPWKTQKMVRRIMNEFYSEWPDGLIGNEDCGQMSAWYVLSALGFYPVNPGQPVYVFGAPLFEGFRVWNTRRGKDLVMSASGGGKGRPFIQSVRWNGKPLNRSWFTHDELLAGGEILVTMGERQNEVWASAPDEVPPSPVREAIALTPVVSPAPTSFEDSLLVSVTSRTPGAVVRYTLDGSEPDERSTAGTTVVVRATSTLKARAFVSGGKASGTVAAEFRKHERVGTVVSVSGYSPQYAASGKQALVDGVRGVVDFRVGGWQGFEGTDLEAVIDLGVIRPVNSIAANFLHDNNAWIFYPMRVKYEVSENGVDYRTVYDSPTDVSPKTETAFIKDVTAALQNEKARFVRVSVRNIGMCPPWHKGNGGKAWLFVDEVVVR